MGGWGRARWSPEPCGTRLSAAAAPVFVYVFLIVAVAAAAAVPSRSHALRVAADGRDPTRGRGGGRVSRRPVFFPSLAWPSCPPPFIPSWRGAGALAAQQGGWITPERVSRQPGLSLSEGCRGWRRPPLPPQPPLLVQLPLRPRWMAEGHPGALLDSHRGSCERHPGGRLSARHSDGVAVSRRRAAGAADFVLPSLPRRKAPLAHRLLEMEARRVEQARAVEAAQQGSAVPVSPVFPPPSRCRCPSPASLATGCWWGRRPPPREDVSDLNVGEGHTKSPRLTVSPRMVRRSKPLRPTVGVSCSPAGYFTCGARRRDDLAGLSPRRNTAAATGVPPAGGTIPASGL